MKRFLDVGGGKTPNIPQYLMDAEVWEHVVLDIDPDTKPDICADARELTALAPSQFEAVYCSHNLEHYFNHEVPKVLAGFLHVLKPGGFAEIRVFDIEAVMKHAVEKKLDIGDEIYKVGKLPVTVRDLLYGWEKENAEAGHDFYAHKTGYSRKSLTGLLNAAGFPIVSTTTGDFEIRALAFRTMPTLSLQRYLAINLLRPKG